MSTLNVNEQFSIALDIEGTPVPLAYGGVKEVSIVQNVKAMIPQFKIIVNDYFNVIHDAAPHDGTKINFIFDDGESLSEVLRFALFGAPTCTDIGSALQFTMTGMLDAATYMHQHVKKSYEGNSNEVLAQVAGEVGLKPMFMATCNDKQVWLPSPVSYAKFMQRIVDHGYVNGNSIMASAVTESHGLIYKNIDEEIKKSGLVTFYNGLKPTSGNPVRLVRFPVVSSQGGVLNRMFGYGTKVQQEQLDGSAKTLDSFMAPLMNGALSMSSEIMKQVDTVYRAYVPPNIGNTHEKFMEARYQNLRGSATFTGKMEVLTDQLTGLNMYDPVETFITLPTTLEVSSLYSQKFLVTAKTRYMRGNQYFEKLELTCQ